MNNRSNGDSRLKTLALLVFLALSSGLATVSAQPTLWYSGDADGFDYYPNEFTPNLSQPLPLMFQPFVVPPGGWTIGTVWVNEAIDPAAPAFTQAFYDIQAAVSNGYSGSIVEQGTYLPCTESATGRSVNGFPEYTIKISGLNIQLSPGTYWLNVAPVNPSSINSLGCSTTSGANAVGEQSGADCFYYYTGDGYYFTPFPVKVSMGIAGPIPPVITWTNPAPIPYGTALGSNQLNATANIPGTFIYTPEAGALLPLGTNTLSATFTPDDTNDYLPATNTVMIVVTPLDVTNPPTSQAADVGGNVSFSVAVSGIGPFLYQWQFNGTNLTDNSQITGSHSNVITLANVEAANAGNYDVIITGPYGSVTSSVVSLTLIGSAGNLFVANSSGSVAEFATNGTGTIISSNIQNSLAFGVAVDGPGDVYVSYANANRIEKFSPVGVDLGAFATNNLDYPQGIAFDSGGNLYAVNATNIEEFRTNGASINFAQTNLFSGPASLAIDSGNNLYVANDLSYSGGDDILKVTPSGVVSVFASVSYYPSGIACDSTGDVYVANYELGNIETFSTNGTLLNSYSVNGNPAGIAFDNSGTLYVALNNLNKIEKYTPSGTDLGTFAANDLSNPQQMAFQFNVSTPPPFYYLTNNGTIEIYGFRAGGAVTIPATINGYPVTFLGSGEPSGQEPMLGAGLVTSLALPDSVTEIGLFSFYGCSGLTNVLLANGLTAIDNFAFSGCGLTSLTFPDSITSIGDNAFYQDFNLASVSIPASLTSIGPGAFYDCTSLTNFSVDGANPDYSSLNGVLFDKAQDALIQFPGALGGSYAVPSSVTVISAGAFIYCDGLTNVTIPNSVTNIEADAFQDCQKLSVLNFLGNAPSPTNDTSVFYGDSLATAYYLQHTMGWGPIFDGIRTMSEAPPAPPLGISTYGGQPTVFYPATATNYLLQMTTNLQTGPWVTISNGIIVTGLVITNPPSGAFFRLQSP